MTLAERQLEMKERQTEQRESRTRLSKREALLRASEIASDPAATPRDALKALTFIERNSTWKRKPRTPRKERSVDDLVREIEAAENFKNIKGGKRTYEQKEQ